MQRQQREKQDESINDNDETRSATSSSVVSASVVSAVSTTVASRTGSGTTSNAIYSSNKLKQSQQQQQQQTRDGTRSESLTDVVEPHRRPPELSPIDTEPKPKPISPRREDNKKKNQEQQQQQQSQRSFSTKLAASKQQQQQQQKHGKPTALNTQKEKDTFLRRTMMQWAKPSSSSSSSSLRSSSSRTTKSALKSSSLSSIVREEEEEKEDGMIQKDPSGEIPTTNSQVTTNSSSKNNSRRISFVPKKTIIPNRSPRGQQPLISPKDRAVMKKMAERNQKSKNKSNNSSKKKTTSAATSALSPRGGNSTPRRAGKLIKSTSSRMIKKLMSSSSSSISFSSSSSSSLKVDEEVHEQEEKEQADIHQAPSIVETVQSKDSHFDDDHDAPDDEYNASSITPKSFEFNRRPIEQSPILEDVFKEEEDGGDGSLMPNKRIRKKSTRGRSSIFKRKLGGMVMGVMDDLIEENDVLSSDDESEFESDGEETEVDDLKKARSIRSQTAIVNNDKIKLKISTSTSTDSSDSSMIQHHQRNQQQQQLSPNINRIIDENKEFLHTMREGPLKQHAYLASSSSLSLNAISESHDEETVEYKTFTNTLKTELASSHVKFYDSFHAMFRDGKLPTKPLSVYPSSLDLKTKEAISSMSKYITNEHDVECLIESQIMRDNHHVIRNHNSNKSISQYQHQRQSTISPRSDTSSDDDDQSEECGSIRLVPSTDSINDYEVTLDQHIRNSVAIPVPSGSFDSSNDSRYLDTKKTKLGRTSSIFKLPPTSGESVPFTSVKLRSRSFSDNQNEEEPIPKSWTKVRLRPVVKTDQQRNDSHADTVTETAEFHRIVLKKTPTNGSAGGGPKKTFDISLNTTTSSVTDVSGTDKKPIDIANAGNAEGQPIKLTETRGSENRPIKLSPMSGTEGKPINLAPSKGGEENPIKLVPSTGGESNPIEMSPSIDLDLNEIMVPLVKEARSGTDVDMHVIVGKNGITKVQSIPGQTTTKANVIWRIERDDVKSALLDISSFHVKVIVASDDKVHQDLCFPTSAQCMRFANALHEMSDTPPKTNGSSGISLASINENKTAGSNDSVYVEQLSDDEQKVLDEFRQRKKDHQDDDGRNGILNAKDFTNELLSRNLPARNAPSVTTKPMSVVNADAPSSPLSEVSCAESALSPDASKTAFKYQLMLKMMKASKNDVKRKMEEDQVDHKVMEFVLGETLPKSGNAAASAPPSSSDISNLSPEEERIASTYRKMLKMRIPLEAVGHKMKKEGVNQKIVSAVLGVDGACDIGDNEEDQPTTSKPDAPASMNLTLSEQAAAQTYKKMLKMCIPKEAVAHKMKKDGVDSKIIAFVLGVPAASKNAASSLTANEESTAATYRKMLKMSIPKEAVRHKMNKEGVSEKIIAAVLGDNKTKVPGKAATQKKRGGFKAGFHWSPIADDVSIAGSVWSKTKTASETGAKQTGPAIDISKHVELFQKKPDKELEKKKKAARSGPGSKEMAKLIDLNRANNVAITLKAFNDFSYKQLSQMIEFIDPYGKIKGDRALFMKDLLPTMAEVKAIKSYTGGDDNLVTAERWFKQIAHIKRIDEKIQVMRTIETFNMDAVVLGKSFKLLTNVCNQIMDSDRLPDLLDMVRQIGNRMNDGRGDEAVGFKLDFLPRLAQTKGSDKKTSALDLVVLIFCTRNQRGNLMLSEDFPDIQEASRMQLSDLTTDVRNLEGSFRKCRKEFDNLQIEQEASLRGKPPQSNATVQMDSRSESALMRPSSQPSSRLRLNGNDANSEIAGMSLNDAIKSRNGLTKEESTPSVVEVLTAIQKSTEVQRNSLSPRASLMAAMEEKNYGKMEFSLEASIRRLEKFVAEVNCVVLPKLEKDRLDAVEACKDLASFFCESGGEKVANNLLKILGGFAAGIDQAVTKYDEQQKILNRKEAAMKKRKNAAASTKSTSSAVAAKDGSIPIKMEKRRPSPEISSKPSSSEIAEQGEKKSLVLMVNEMLKIAGDKDIEDYMQGKVNENPDHRLKKIYQAEESRTTSARGDILSAIRKRRSISTNPVPQQALSDLRAKLEDTRIELDSIHVSTEKKQDNMVVRPKARKSRVADRWSSKKVEEKEMIISDTKENNSNRNSHDDSMMTTKKTDSEILTSLSQDTNDVEINQKQRQSYMNRWASKTPVLEATVEDLDEESDIGAFQEMIDKRRQKAISRWSSK